MSRLVCGLFVPPDPAEWGLGNFGGSS